MSSAERRPIPLPPKAFEALLYFVERRGELLEKTTLLKAIWPNIIVEENSLNQNISVIRRALGESPGEHRFIVTEPGRGYRFVADVGVVAEVPSVAAQAPIPTPTRTAAPASAVKVGQRKSIAVLAFANLTGDPAKEYFSDGMAEELIHILARIPGLKVPSRTSSFSYKGRNMDVRQISRDLDVGVVLEGSVRGAGERIRVTAQLIDGASGFHLWSQSYDRDFADLFKLQDDLAHEIVRILRVAMDERPTGDASQGPPTSHLEAYNLYLQAMSVQSSSAPWDALPRAMKMFERVIAMDPQFARAHSATAALRAVAIALDVPLPGVLADSERQALRALVLDPSSGSAHAALGIIYAAQGQWLSAEERFRDAFARDADDPFSQTAYGMHLLGTVGYLRRYAEISFEAYRSAPAWIPGIMNLTVAHVLLGEAENAHKFAELFGALAVRSGEGPMQDVFAQLAMRDGRYEEAGELAATGMPARIAADGGADTIRRLFRVVRDRAGVAAQIEALDELRARLTSAELTQFMKRRFIVWYTLLGALDQAFELLNESLEHFAQSGTIGAAWGFLWMREMLPFRQHPTFQSTCHRMGLFEYWNKYGPPDNCELRGGELICH